MNNLTNLSIFDYIINYIRLYIDNYNKLAMNIISNILTYYKKETI